MKSALHMFLLFIVTLALGCENYDHLVDLDATCDQKWADVDVQLQRRYDMIPNLVAA